VEPSIDKAVCPIGCRRTDRVHNWRHDGVGAAAAAAPRAVGTRVEYPVKDPALHVVLGADPPAQARRHHDTEATFVKPVRRPHAGPYCCRTGPVAASAVVDVAFFVDALDKVVLTVVGARLVFCAAVAGAGTDAVCCRRPNGVDDPYICGRCAEARHNLSCARQRGGRGTRGPECHKEGIHRVGGATRVGQSRAAGEQRRGVNRRWCGGRSKDSRPSGRG